MRSSVIYFTVQNFCFFYSSISIIMTDVLQGKIQQQCKIFLFPKRIPFLFLNLFGWSKSWPRPHTTNAQWRFARLLLKPRFILWPVKSATSYSGDFFSRWWRISFPLLPIKMGNKLLFLLFDWEKNPFVWPWKVQRPCHIFSRMERCFGREFYEIWKAIWWSNFGPFSMHYEICT